MDRAERIEAAIAAYIAGDTIDVAGQKWQIPFTSLQRVLHNRGVVRAYTKRRKVIADLQDKTFGHLTTIEPIVESEGRVLWLCRCSCGTIQKVRQTKLASGVTDRCGNCNMTGELSFKWKGVGELSGTCWKHIRMGAVRKSRTLDFEISQEYAWDLYQKQAGRCALSGIDIPFPKIVTKGNFPSLDRIDSQLGYVEGNVQWVHKDINRMKWSLDEGYFVELCNLVVKNKENKNALSA